MSPQVAERLRDHDDDVKKLAVLHDRRWLPRRAAGHLLSTALRSAL
jgi:hypothetical protein